MLYYHKPRLQESLAFLEGDASKAITELPYDRRCATSGVRTERKQVPTTTEKTTDWCACLACRSITPHLTCRSLWPS